MQICKSTLVSKQNYEAYSSFADTDKHDLNSYIVIANQIILIYQEPQLE